MRKASLSELKHHQGEGSAQSVRLYSQLAHHLPTRLNTGSAIDTLAAIEVILYIPE